MAYLRKLFPIPNMYNQWIICRASLCGKDLAHRRAVQGIGAQPVNRLRGKRHQFSPAQEFCTPGQAFLIGGKQFRFQASIPSFCFIIKWRIRCYYTLLPRGNPASMRIHGKIYASILYEKSSPHLSAQRAQPVKISKDRSEEPQSLRIDYSTTS